MRLFKRAETGIWYVEIKRGAKRSLKTKDKREAQFLFNEIKKQHLRGNIRVLEKTTSITISEFQKHYTSNPDRVNLSPETHRADNLALKLLRESVGNLDMNSIKGSHITKFKSDCMARELKPVSINSYLRHIKAALRYAKLNDFLLEVPAVKYVKVPKELPRPISPEDITKMLEAAEQKPEMHRIIKFTLFTGCRRKEIIGLRYEHVTRHEDGHWMITITGKGDKERIIPLVGDAKDVLKNQQIGKIFSYKHTSTISNYFREIVRSCGVMARFHDLRHTAATQMLNRGIPMEVVQKILGHEEIRTTQIYAEVLGETLSNEMEKMGY